MSGNGKGRRWVRVGNTFCEDTPELRAALRAEQKRQRDIRRAVAADRGLGGLWQNLRHALAEFWARLYREP